MKKKSTLRLFAGIALVLSSSAFALTGHSAMVTRITTVGDGRVALQFDADSSACSATGSPKAYYVAVGQNGVTADGLKNILAAAMMSFSLSKQVTIYFDETTNACYVSQLTVLN